MVALVEGIAAVADDDVFDDVPEDELVVDELLAVAVELVELPEPVVWLVAATVWVADPDSSWATRPVNASIRLTLAAATNRRARRAG